MKTKVRILVRADSGFARDELRAWCEASGMHFLFGVSSILLRRTENEPTIQQAK